MNEQVDDLCRFGSGQDPEYKERDIFSGRGNFISIKTFLFCKKGTIWDSASHATKKKENQIIFDVLLNSQNKFLVNKEL